MNLVFNPKDRSNSLALVESESVSRNALTHANAELLPIKKSVPHSDCVTAISFDSAVEANSFLEQLAAGNKDEFLALSAVFDDKYWPFVEEYLPHYSSSDKVLWSDILTKHVEGQGISENDLEYLHSVCGKSMERAKLELWLTDGSLIMESLRAAASTTDNSISLPTVKNYEIPKSLNEKAALITTIVSDYSKCLEPNESLSM